MGSMTGRGQEVVDFMERRKVNIVCVQETCHLERGQHDWQGTRGRGCYGAEEG